MEKFESAYLFILQKKRVWNFPSFDLKGHPKCLFLFVRKFVLETGISFLFTWNKTTRFELEDVRKIQDWFDY